MTSARFEFTKENKNRHTNYIFTPTPKMINTSSPKKLIASCGI